MVRKISLTMVLVVLLLTRVSAFAENIAIIVNKDSPLFLNKATVETRDIKDIYLGKLRFSGGYLIKPVNQSGKDIVVKFIKQACGMELTEYQYHWVKLELEAGMNAPRMEDRYSGVLKYVQKEKSGIGYVWENQAKDIEGIKIVLLIFE